jgi:clan AA aspartic protease
MTGVVDLLGRALVPVHLKKSGSGGKFIKLQAWIDTGFTGELVLPKSVIEMLGLSRANVVRAELGDGSEAVFDTFSCTLKWMGKTREIEALESSGDLPLLGVTLLKGYKLTIDYERDRVSVV